MTETPTPEQISAVMRHMSLKCPPESKVRKLPRSHFVKMGKNSWKNRPPPIPVEEWKKQQEAKKAESARKKVKRVRAP